MLNGMLHLDRLAARFGDRYVLGGFCLISAALDRDGAFAPERSSHTRVW